MIGNVASNDAACIAVAASNPGARNARYETPPMAFVGELETYEPRPSPMAVRKRTGDRNEVNTVDRNVRRYWSQWCSKTRPMVDVGRARAVTLGFA
jgi:hypothetical protein